MLTPFWPIVVALGAFACDPTPAEEAKTEETVVLKPDPDAYRPEQTPDVTDVAKRIVALTNDLRVEKKLYKLKIEPKLDKAAEAFAAYMARTNRYGHLADDRDPAERVKDAEYEPCLVDENIAYAFRTQGFRSDLLAKEFFEGWKHSPGHLKNMLDPDVTDTAVAIREGTGGYFFAVQVFGRPTAARFEFKLTNEAEAEFEYEMGDESLKLLPRQTRTHQTCRPDALRFTWRDAEKAGHRVTPVLDDHFIVTRDGENFQVRKK